MPLTEKQLRTRDAKRDLGAELLAAVRDMKAGRGAVVGRFPTSTKKTHDAMAKPHQNRLLPSPKELDKALTLSADRARRMADAFGLKVPGATAKPSETERRSMTSALKAQNGSSNVFRDLGFPESEAQLLLLKCDLAMRICKAIDKLDLAPAKAAKHVGLTLTRLNQLTKNRSDTFTLDDLVTVVVKLGYSVKLKIKRSELKSEAPNAKKTSFKSDAFEAIHSSASALHEIGAIDKTTMCRVDAAALKKSPKQNLLTPPPKELQKALALSAKRARALADAYGVKVPYARVKAPKLIAST
jgi:predicted XRE-type DNA-binding protein/DNA-binding transcriptional regulator YiaG